MLNIGILNQIKSILDGEGIVCSFANMGSKNCRILVYGEKNLRDFMSKIPIRNPKHLEKIEKAGLGFKS